MPALSAVIAPFIACDIALPTLTESEGLFRFSVLKNRLSFTVGNVFIQSPDRGALLLGNKKVNNSSFGRCTVDIVRLCCGYLIRTDHSCRTGVICPESADLGKSMRRSEYDQLGSRASI